MTADLAGSLALVMGSVVLGVVGQLILKRAMERLGPLSVVGDSIPLVVVRMVTQPLLWLGLFVYAASAGVWIAALGRVDLSYAYPILASSLLFVTVGARVVLGEPVSRVGWLSVLLIVVGILFVTFSA